VPLSGKLTGIASVAINQTTGTASVAISGSGNISHLGKSTFQAHHIVYFQRDGSTVIGGGVATITAANGDQLVLDYTGKGTPNAYGGFNDTFNFTVDPTLSTGRFAGATGSGVIHSNDLPGGTVMTGFPFTGDIEGQISTVGSNKKS
jgi:hypothetical protein